MLLLEGWHKALIWTILTLTLEKAEETVEQSEAAEEAAEEPEAEKEAEPAVEAAKPCALFASKSRLNTLVRHFHSIFVKKIQLFAFLMVVASYLVYSEADTICATCDAVKNFIIEKYSAVYYSLIPEIETSEATPPVVEEPPVVDSPPPTEEL